ncbi:aldo/keto reductase [Sediminicurvatus halobius]|uniref:Aldo/keto reductase n=1 Tax=Sediminicurvatus halobius TaxID=2182432 RepID=A0A2U2N4I4_9GAMM|nr:aldo/keto reductase [Spiribacter halobius]PWG64141.1 aldo/keto reductase [Spiribacter halobius]UEX78738.1 aldo/keto reductase [Spiribacter halobius]
METLEVHGARIPKLGFGTFQLDDEVAYARVRDALDAGCRHIDTAQMYRNEEAVGEAIRDAGVPRDAVFLTTKVWVDRFRDGDLQRSVEESLKRLGLPAVDLVLLHWPNPDIPLAETISALNDARAHGLTAHIGVSNFTVALLREAVAASAEPLVTNQVEYHPRLNQDPVRAELARHGMALTAYCPLGQGSLVDDPVIRRIADAHDRTPGQVILRWHYQQPDVIAIPRTSKAERVRENLDILDFRLSDEEMQAIHGLAREDGRIISPASLAPAWDNAG